MICVLGQRGDYHAVYRKNSVRSILTLTRRVGCTGLLLLLPILALACGGDANARQTAGSATDVSPVLDATLQSPSEAPGGGDVPGSEPVETSDNPSIINLAVGAGSATDDPAAAEPSAAADQSGNSATAPGVEPIVPKDPTRTWATTPGVDPAAVGDPTGTLGRTSEDEAPSAMPLDAAQEPFPDALELARGNAQFAFDVYRELAASQGNLFLSPHGVSEALAMTYAGARGDTETAMPWPTRCGLRCRRTVCTPRSACSPAILMRVPTEAMGRPSG